MARGTPVALSYRAPPGLFTQHHTQQGQPVDLQIALYLASGLLAALACIGLGALIVRWPTL